MCTSLLMLLLTAAVSMGAGPNAAAVGSMQLLADLAAEQAQQICTFDGFFNRMDKVDMLGLSGLDTADLQKITPRIDFQAACLRLFYGSSHCMLARSTCQRGTSCYCY